MHLCSILISHISLQPENGKFQPLELTEAFASMCSPPHSLHPCSDKTLNCNVCRWWSVFCTLFSLRPHLSHPLLKILPMSVTAQIIQAPLKQNGENQGSEQECDSVPACQQITQSAQNHPETSQGTDKGLAVVTQSLVGVVRVIFSSCWAPYLTL